MTPTSPHPKQHLPGSAMLQDIVIDLSDGLMVPFALAAGLSGAVASSSPVITAGLAEIVTGSIAMGRGGYLAGRTEVEHYAVELAREHQEVRELPDVERREVKDLFLNKKPVVFQVLFGTRNGSCSKNPRIQAWPNQKDHSGIVIG